MKIRVYPDPVLRHRSKPIKDITDEIWAKAQQMLESMYENNGVGLAAPQVGWNIALITVDTAGVHKGRRAFVNPQIVERNGEAEDEEGCLSLPRLSGKVRRSESVIVSAYDLDGKDVQIEANGLLARAFQHEIDHLRGVLFIDRLSDSDRMALRQSLRNLERIAGK